MKGKLYVLENDGKFYANIPPVKEKIEKCVINAEGIKNICFKDDLRLRKKK